MVDQEQTAEDITSAMTEGADPQAYSRDWFLQDLVLFAELGFEQHITFTVGGSQINGLLVSGRKFFERLAEATANLAPDAPAESLLGSIVSRYREYAEIYPDPENLEADDSTVRNPASYLHLEDARWFSADGHSIPGNGMLWRGKVSAVDGFALGQLRAEPR